MSPKEEETDQNVFNCLGLTISWLYWPVPLVTLVVLGHRCYKQKRLCEALPLLATQLNSVLCWVCKVIQEAGYFNYVVNGTHFVKGDYNSLRSFMITNFLNELIYLESLNLFLYT
jgi:hypothetical protein